MRKIKITEAQAKMLKEMGEDTPKNRVIKITEAQYQKILEMETRSLQNEDELVGVSMPTNKVPSNAVKKNFEKGFSKSVKKEVGKLYEEFLNELYGVNEGSGKKYENLIKLMEVAGLIENSRIKKSKFNDDKNLVRDVISNGLYEMMNGASNYKIMEIIENRLSENGGYPAGAEFDPNAPWNQEDEYGEEEGFVEADSYPFELIHYNLDNDGFTLFRKDGRLFVHIGAEHDGELMNDYCADPSGADADCVNNFINDLYNNESINIGTDPFNDLLAVVTPENKDEILKYYGDDKKLVAILNGLDEVTTAASSGSFESPMAMGNKFKSNVPEELDEVTTTTSVGGSSGTFAYDAPVGDGSDFWKAGNKLNKKGKNKEVTNGTPISVYENSGERYVAEMDFYIIANSDEEAKTQANEIAEMLDKQFDNKASVTKLLKQSHGTLGGTPIEENYSDEERENRQNYLILLNMHKNASGYEREEIKPKLIAAAKKLGIELQLRENAFKDTQYPGGGFVDLDDCVKYNNNKVAQNGGCNQGDSGVVTLKGSNDSIVAKKNVYEAVAKKTGKTVDEVKAIINKTK